MDSLGDRSLTWLGEHTAYLPGGVNIGIIMNEKREAVIIDTGLNASSGNKVLRALELEKLTPVAIINTHSHADHFGGNSTILKKFSIPVYGTLEDRGIMENPIFEPFYLYGANPPEEMRVKFLMAEKSPVTNLVEPSQEKLEIAEMELSIMDLSGHSPSMIGIGYKKEAIFMGDAFFPRATAEKYPVIYCYNVEKTLEKIEQVKKLLCEKENGGDNSYKYFVPAHGKPSELPIEDVLALEKGILGMSKFILDALSVPLSREEIVKILFLEFDISESMPQYYLTTGSVGAYLTYFLDKRLIKSKIYEGVLKFYRE